MPERYLKKCPMVIRSAGVRLRDDWPNPFFELELAQSIDGDGLRAFATLSLDPSQLRVVARIARTQTDPKHDDRYLHEQLKNTVVWAHFAEPDGLLVAVSSILADDDKHLLVTNHVLYDELTRKVETDD